MESEYDVATRLKMFMDHTKLPHSQFADACRIPRPTLSQILGRRNKKVSDEIIGKLHAQFPNLNILWLMFGEGDMLLEGNSSFSEPQKVEKTSTQVTEPLEVDLFSVSEAPTQPTSESKPIQKNEPAPQRGHHNVAQHATNNNTISLHPTSQKRIKNIMVFYTDSSFETFTPAY